MGSSYLLWKNVIITSLSFRRYDRREFIEIASLDFLFSFNLGKEFGISHRLTDTKTFLDTTVTTSKLLTLSMFLPVGHIK